MLRLYRSLVRSKLDYGCIVYGSAHKSYLQMLDPIHNQGLRLCIGAFRTSPVESLYIDAHEPCLGARRAKLSLQDASKIKSLPNHPRMMQCLITNISSCLMQGRMPSVPLAFALSSFELLPTFIFQTFWKHLHILYYHLGASSHQRLC